jgi:DNA-binding transcriptional LysR family regulator
MRCTSFDYRCFLRDFSPFGSMLPREGAELNLTRLQTFVEVVRRGTFAGAADALSFTPSAVSQQMAKLEAETGLPLLEREGAGVRLTEAGRLLHEHAVGIVDSVHRARISLIALQAQQVKRLRLAADPVAASAVVPRALRLLRRRLPGTELVLEETAADEALRAGRADVGVWLAPAAEPVDPALDETVLERGELLVALPAEHPLTRLRELDAEALAATPRICDDSPWRVRSVRTQLALVSAGEGYALVPGPAADPLPSGVTLCRLAGAPAWELRAARPASELPSVGTLAAIEALRTAAGASRPPRYDIDGWQSAGRR